MSFLHKRVDWRYGEGLPRRCRDALPYRLTVGAGSGACPGGTETH